MVGLPVVVAVHEAGHLLACLALRAKVRGVQFGNGKSAWLRFTVRGVEVLIGAPYSGRVLYADATSASRRAIITAAGALANLAAAAALFAASPWRTPVAAAAPSSLDQRWNPIVAATLFVAGHAGNVAAFGLALLMLVVGVTNLLPYRMRSGRPTDGARLLGLLGGPFAAALRQRDAKGWLPLASTPAALRAEFNDMARVPFRPLPPEQATRWLKAYWDREPLALYAVGFIGRSLRLQGRITDLLALHADLPRPAGPLARQLAMMAHMLDWEVLLVPELPAAEVDRAVGRVMGVLRNVEFESAKPWRREDVLHTLALGRLRQRRFAEVEDLCQPALAVPELPASSRATVLATVALARRAAGLPCDQELAEARFLDPDADLVAEAMEQPSSEAPDRGATGTRQAQGV
jgi:hypothetical protein